MTALRANRNILAHVAALATLLQVLLGTLCPHSLLGGTAAARRIDPIATGITCPAHARTGHTGHGNHGSNGPAHGSSPCCAACTGPAPLLLTLASAALTAWHFGNRQTEPLWPLAAQPTLPLAPYAGRGSRAPPHFA